MGDRTRSSSNEMFGMLLERLQFELWKKCIAIRKPLPWEDEANRKSSYLLRIVINAGGRLKTDVA